MLENAIHSLSVHFTANLSPFETSIQLRRIHKTCQWLNIYFSSNLVRRITCNVCSFHSPYGSHGLWKVHSMHFAPPVRSVLFPFPVEQLIEQHPKIYGGYTLPPLPLACPSVQNKWNCTLKWIFVRVLILLLYFRIRLLNVRQFTYSVSNVAYVFAKTAYGFQL